MFALNVLDSGGVRTAQDVMLLLTLTRNVQQLQRGPELLPDLCRHLRAFLAQPLDTC
jgi:hypothetical protein